MSDPFRDLVKWMKENKIGFVFWVCPKGCNGRVKWNEDKTDATCEVCGMTKKQAETK